jgi:large subunit ribosomal protein L32
LGEAEGFAILDFCFAILLMRLRLSVRNRKSKIQNVGGVIMPNPKRRHSKARRGKRRAHDALRTPQTVVCPNCQEPRMQHRVCPKCGYYKGREVVQVDQTA